MTGGFPWKYLEDGFVPVVLPGAAQQPAQTFEGHIEGADAQEHLPEADAPTAWPLLIVAVITCREHRTSWSKTKTPPTERPQRRSIFLLLAASFGVFLVVSDLLSTFSLTLAC